MYLIFKVPARTKYSLFAIIILLIALLQFLICFAASLHIHEMMLVILFSLDESEGDYNEETELFEQECNDFMKAFVAKIFLKE